MNLRDMLIREEGREYKAYPDPLTHAEPWTIGVGHAVGVGKNDVWTDSQIDAALTEDIERATYQCKQHFPWFDGLNEARQAVLISMTFQMGISRLLGFANTLACVGRGDYQAASNGMLASVWARQTPKRAARLAEQMLCGEWV